MAEYKRTREPRRNEVMDPARRRARYMEGVEEIHSNDYELLRRFMTEQGKILPSRITGTSPMQQRQLKRAIRRARVMGLLR